jgi:hypothetical protein
MPILDDYDRVSRTRRCPICERSDWCLVAKDGSSAVCQRVPSSRRYGAAGHLHLLGGGHPAPAGVPQLMLRQTPDFGTFACAAQAAFSERACRTLARQLGVDPEALRALCVGYSARYDAHTFPMWAGDRIVGIRLRSADGGRKWCIAGSRQGVFLPRVPISFEGPVLVTEGATDTAAALSLGFEAIGRPAASGGVCEIRRLLRRRGSSCSAPAQILVFGDSDDVGRRTAEDLRSRLAPYARVSVAYPPSGCKDLREWVRQGADAVDILLLIWNAFGKGDAADGRTA